MPFRPIAIAKRKVPSFRKFRPRRSFSRAPASSYVGSQGYFRLGKTLSKRILKTQERNFVDTTLANMLCDTTGQVTLINTIAQGVTVNQRIGKKALLKSVQVRGSFTPNVSANVNTVGLLLVYDSQSNGAAIPAITDILTAATPFAFTNNDNTHRFVILRRWQKCISGPLGGTAPFNDCSDLTVDDYVKLDREIEWNVSAATGVQTTIQKGALYLVSFGDHATGGGNLAGFWNGQTRVRFTEEY